MNTTTNTTDTTARYLQLVARRNELLRAIMVDGEEVEFALESVEDQLYVMEMAALGVDAD